MLRFSIVWFALLVLGWDKVTAQSSTTSSAVPTHVISVGIEGLQFTPSELSANVSDVIGMRFAKVVFMLSLVWRIARCANR